MGIRNFGVCVSAVIASVYNLYFWEPFSQENVKTSHEPEPVLIHTIKKQLICIFPMH
jgi:hypothetical protein